MSIARHSSPNFSARRLNATPDLIVLHYTAMVSAEAALDRLCDPTHQVSAHYLIGSGGETAQMVDEDQRAWHAGAGSWGNCSDVNSRSVGIELANSGQTPFAASQMNALETLLGAVMRRWAIPPERVIAHSDMAPMRKFDPGTRFDWRRLALNGLSVWPGKNLTADVDPAVFRNHALRFGYGADVPDQNLLSAFRLRFRPWAFGPLGPGDMGVMKYLADRFPVDRIAASL